MDDGVGRTPAVREKARRPVFRRHGLQDGRSELDRIRWVAGPADVPEVLADLLLQFAPIEAVFDQLTPNRVTGSHRLAQDHVSSKGCAPDHKGHRRKRLIG